MCKIIIQIPSVSMLIMFDTRPYLVKCIVPLGEVTKQTFDCIVSNLYWSSILGLEFWKMATRKLYAIRTEDLAKTKSGRLDTTIKRKR